MFHPMILMVTRHITNQEETINISPLKHTITLLRAEPEGAAAAPLLGLNVDEASNCPSLCKSADLLVFTENTFKIILKT